MSERTPTPLLVFLGILLGAGCLTWISCFSLTPPDGTIQCSPDPGRACPNHYVCFEGTCWQRPPIDFGGDALDAGDL
jgi:hypothetical protein